MVYKIGAVGLGHWFRRLWYGLKDTEQIKIVRAAAVSDVFSKTESLKEVGLTPDDYYRVAPGEPLPEKFFEGLDLVHISNPNEFHSSQTEQALEHGKYVITEKTWGVNRKEFESVARFLKERDYEKKAYLHLHYLHKQLTQILPSLLKQYTAKYGKITNAHLTFFERKNDEDDRRKTWLFSGRNGGLFMDWVHPYEVLSNGAQADNISVQDTDLFEVNSSYNTIDATGVYTYVDISGKYFANNAMGEISIAKGVNPDLHTKRARLYFESGHYLELNYVDSEVEFRNHTFGNYQLVEQKDGRATVIEKHEPAGKNTAELFVEDILRLCRGEGPMFGMDVMQKIFKPQWEYQRLAKDKKLISDAEQISKFLQYGFSPTEKLMEERVKSRGFGHGRI